MTKLYQIYNTPPKFNIAPEKWLEDYSPIGKVTFWGLCLTSGGGGGYVMMTDRQNETSSCALHHDVPQREASDLHPNLIAANSLVEVLEQVAEASRPCITYRIHGMGIFTNMYHKDLPNVGVYIYIYYKYVYHTGKLWVMGMYQDFSRGNPSECHNSPSLIHRLCSGPIIELCAEDIFDVQFM